MSDCEFKVGDKVIITRASTEEEDSGGYLHLWDNGWYSYGMDNMIGKTVTISHIFGKNQVLIKEDGGHYSWPMFVMKRVSNQLLFSFMKK